MPIRNRTTLRAILRKGITALSAALLLSGCGASLQMAAPEIPEPLLEPIPARIALRIPEEFHDYEHTEEVLGRESWTINLGDSSAVLFTDLFNHMFSAVTVIGPDDDPRDLTIDAVIEPSIDAFEFSVPAQTRSDSFAVWIRYKLNVYDRSGTLVSSWPVPAYGKADKAGMGGTDELQVAAVLAMRDAAALMVMKLDNETGISKLARRPKDPVPAIDDVPGAPDDELPLDDADSEPPEGATEFAHNTFLEETADAID